jgi:hypothetical protein
MGFSEKGNQQGNQLFSADYIEELERENDKFREALGWALDRVVETTIEARTYPDEFQKKRKEYDDLLSNPSDHRHQPGVSVETKSNL